MDKESHYRFVVVTRPTGYKPTNDFFLRIPFNDNRSDLSVDFGFQRDPSSANRKFWFMTASDSQFTSIEQMIPIAKDYAQITSAPGEPAFLATAGDLTMTGSQFEWDMYDQIRRSSKILVYEGFGGHDGNCLDPRCTVSFEQRIGPPYYSWDYGGVHFIQFVTETGYLLSTAQRRQQEWLAADLQALPPKTPVIAISHYPLDPQWFDQRKGRRDQCHLSDRCALARRPRGKPKRSSGTEQRARTWQRLGRFFTNLSLGLCRAHRRTFQIARSGPIQTIKGSCTRSKYRFGKAASGSTRLRYGPVGEFSHLSLDLSRWPD